MTCNYKNKWMMTCKYRNNITKLYSYKYRNNYTIICIRISLTTCKKTCTNNSTFTLS